MRILFLITAMCAFYAPWAYSKNSDLDSKKTPFAYAENIEVKCYIVTRKQLSDLFNQKEKTVVQLPTKDLHHPLEVYFLIRVKNTGKMAASGMLHCFVPCCGYPFPIKIMKMPPKMKSYQDFVVRFDAGLIRPEDPKPVITYEWNQLDSYPLK